MLIFIPAPDDRIERAIKSITKLKILIAEIASLIGLAILLYHALKVEALWRMYSPFLRL